MADDTKTSKWPESMGWKTITGILLAALAAAADPATGILDIVPAPVARVLTIIGFALAGYGIRHAQAKAIDAASSGGSSS